MPISMEESTQCKLAPPLPPRINCGSMAKTSSSIFHNPTEASTQQFVLPLEGSRDFINVCVSEGLESVTSAVLNNYDELNDLETFQFREMATSPEFATTRVKRHCWADPLATMATIQHFHLSPSHKSSTISKLKTAVASSLRLKSSSSSFGQHSTPCSPRRFLPTTSIVEHSNNCSHTHHMDCVAQQLNTIESYNTNLSTMKTQTTFAPSPHITKFTVVRDYIEENTDVICFMHPSPIVSHQAKSSFQPLPNLDRVPESYCANEKHIDKDVAMDDVKTFYLSSSSRPAFQLPPTPKPSTESLQSTKKVRQSLSSKESDDPVMISSKQTHSYSTIQPSLSSRLKRTSQHIRSCFVNSLRKVFPSAVRLDRSASELPTHRTSSIFQRFRAPRRTRSKIPHSSGSLLHQPQGLESWTVSAFHSPVSFRRKPTTGELVFSGHGKRRSASASQLDYSQYNQHSTTELLLENDHFIEVINQETCEHELAQRVNPQSLLAEEVRQSRMYLYRGLPLIPPRDSHEMPLPPPLPPRHSRCAIPSSSLPPLPPRVSTRHISQSQLQHSPLVERSYHDAARVDNSSEDGSEIQISLPQRSTQSRSRSNSSPEHEGGLEFSLPTILENMNRLKKMGWYWGPLTSKEAKTLLLRYRDGTFLLRDSEHETYLLSASFKARGRVFHARIEYFAGEFFLANQPEDPRSPCILSFLDLLIRRSISGDMHFFTQPAFGHVGQGAVGGHDEEDAHGGVVNGDEIGIPEETPLNSTRVALLYPLSRFSIVQTLTHLCRFEILLRVRHDHIDRLPLPEAVKCYLREGQYCTDLSLLHCYTGDAINTT